MSVYLPYNERLAEYDLGPGHPLKPERFTLAYALMDAYGILSHGNEPPRPDQALTMDFPSLQDGDLELIHDHSYIAAVKHASQDPSRTDARHGIGEGDTPTFYNMHAAAARICAATSAALNAVITGDAQRAFSVAGGLHHAHRSSAAGFCVYNDPAVAIAVARRDYPDLRIAYVDIDAHHGDGVEEAFYADPSVLTLSVHESGRYLFPGTGRVVDRGTGQGYGSAINVPLPPLSNDTSYAMVTHDIIIPALRAFAPDAIVAQCGADAHHADPLTHLGLTHSGHRALIRALIASAEEHCEGRICCTGGGGYGTYAAVPIEWTAVLAELLGVELGDELPESWRRMSEEASGKSAPLRISQDSYTPLPAVTERVQIEVAALVARIVDGSPLLNE